MTTSEPGIPALPERIGALATLATNLWWSWSRDARNLFRSIDALLWHQTRHNPIALLQLVEPARLTELAGDEEFLLQLDRVCGVRVAQLRADLLGRLGRVGW
jgi:starch phosphorylase